MKESMLSWYIWSLVVVNVARVYSYLAVWRGDVSKNCETYCVTYLLDAPLSFFDTTLFPKNYRDKDKDVQPSVTKTFVSLKEVLRNGETFEKVSSK